jgi:chromosome partitioning protein
MKPQTIDDKLAIMRADNGLLAIDKAEIEVISRPGAYARAVRI